MLKRLNIYFKEMYPIIPRLLLALIVFLEIYFIILLNKYLTNMIYAHTLMSKKVFLALVYIDFLQIFGNYI